jgi:hypothetical protein
LFSNWVLSKELFLIQIQQISKELDPRLTEPELIVNGSFEVD